MPPARNRELPPHLRTRILELHYRILASSKLKLLKNIACQNLQSKLPADPLHFAALLKCPNHELAQL
jgi:hypothetical protein